MYTFFNKAREPMNSLTHFIGAALAMVGTVLLAAAAAESANLRTLVGALVFGLSLVALYSASSLYHYVACTPSTLLRLRKLDHAMIFVLIAGTYTPLFLAFSKDRGILLTIVIWAIAATGIVLKIFWMDMPRWLSTLFYVLMGWALVFDIQTLRALPLGCIILLLVGGIAYTAGAVIYAIKKPNWFKRFGFHELFHVFVLFGSLFHFLAIFLYAM